MFSDILLIQFTSILGLNWFQQELNIWCNYYSIELCCRPNSWVWYSMPMSYALPLTSCTIREMLSLGSSQPGLNTMFALPIIIAFTVLTPALLCHSSFIPGRRQMLILDSSARRRWRWENSLSGSGGKA